MRRDLCCLIVLFVIACAAQGQVGSLGRAGAELVEAIAKAAGKQTARDAAQELAELGGEQAVRELGERLLADGGEEALDRAIHLVAVHGPTGLRPLRAADRPYRLLAAIDELADAPAHQAAALSRLVAEPRLASHALEAGADALRLEAAHPGRGIRLMDSVGAVHAGQLLRLPTREIGLLAQRADELVDLPPAQRESFLRVALRWPEQIGSWMAEFTRRNPTKVLLTSASVMALIALDEELLGESVIVTDPTTGLPTILRKPGALDPLLEAPGTVADSISSNLRWPFIAGFVAILLVAAALALRVWGLRPAVVASLVSRGLKKLQKKSSV